MPILIYGECFYLSNQAAFNYLSFNEEIYSSFYAKLAMFSYYLPDIFLFISGFLFASKVIQHQNLMQAIVDKVARLYPLYLATLLIYWLVSPGLHAGPVWFVYEEQVAVCDGSWWKVLPFGKHLESNSDFAGRGYFYALWYFLRHRYSSGTSIRQTYTNSGTMCIRSC